MRKCYFYACLCMLAAFLFPTSPEGDPRSPKAAEVERNQFQLPLTGLAEHATRVQGGETLGSIMHDQGISPDVIRMASEKASSYIDLRKIRKGDPLYAYTDPAEGTTSFIVYQPSVERFLVFDLRDSVLVHEDFFPVSTVTRTGSGTVKTSLSQAVEDAGLNPELTTKLSDIFAWQISFFHLQPEDNFSLQFEEKIVNGHSISVDIRGARMNHDGKDFFAFFFPSDSIGGFYDESGHSLRRPFLRAPINYRRISSRYSLRRFHPVQKRYKPHLGTDFAAARGTPIFATADGSVIAASYTRGNGNYVKIRHNDVYTTGYLHMSRIENGIRPGVRVNQGQRIGYVGSTGFATGPHVCYRFWKNGRQVDAMKVEMPPSEPLPEEFMPQFNQIVNQLKSQLVSSANPAAD